MKVIETELGHIHLDGNPETDPVFGLHDVEAPGLARLRKYGETTEAVFGVKKRADGLRLMDTLFSAFGTERLRVSLHVRAADSDSDIEILRQEVLTKEECEAIVAEYSKVTILRFDPLDTPDNSSDYASILFEQYDYSDHPEATPTVSFVFKSFNAAEKFFEALEWTKERRQSIARRIGILATTYSHLDQKTALPKSI